MRVVEWTPQCEAIAQSVAHDYYFPGGDRDDVLQEARIGVWKALNDFRPDAGSSFASFAVLCARRQALTGLATAQRGKHRVLTEATSFETPVAEAGDAPLGELLARPDRDDPARMVEDREEIRRVLAGLASLTELERECMLRVRLGGESYDAVGERKRVDNALARGAEKLRVVAAPAAPRERKVYVDRELHRTEQEAIAEAQRVVPGWVVAVAKRKLLDGHERAPQGRPDRHGRRGRPVWRVDLLAA